MLASTGMPVETTANEMLAWLAAAARSVRDAELAAQFPQITAPDRVQCINWLLSTVRSGPPVDRDCTEFGRGAHCCRARRARADACHGATHQGRIVLARSQGDIRYCAARPEDAAKFAGMTIEDRLVYQLIEKSGKLGIWTRDLLQQSNLHRNVLNKIIKSMENKRLIKSVKSVVVCTSSCSAVCAAGMPG